MNWIRNFMVGRHGIDQLSIGLAVLSLPLTWISRFRGWGWLILLANALLLLCAFRMLSRNREKRWAENQTFLKLAQPIIDSAKGLFKRLGQSKQYHFYSCPKCAQRLRVPRGRGKLEISCPKCGASFTKKT